MNRIILVMGMKQTDRQTDRQTDGQTGGSQRSHSGGRRHDKIETKTKKTKIDQYRTGPSARRWGINETSVCRQNVGELAEGLSRRAVLH